MNVVEDLFYNNNLFLLQAIIHNPPKLTVLKIHLKEHTF